MKLNEIKGAVAKTLGIEKLNEIQNTVAASDARRLIVLAPTGSGKTIAYTLAVLERLDPSRVTPPEAVIIGPSRELVQQIHGVVRPVAAEFGLKTIALYGGNRFSDEESSIEGRLPDIVVATPGRLLDHINRGTLEVSRVSSLILDEYDKILELGFQDEMRRVVRRVGASLKGGAPRFVMVTSATRLKAAPAFANLDRAEVIDLSESNSVETRLRIVNVPSPSRDKLDTLAALVRAIPDGPIIVFVNHRESADRVGAYLDRQHISNIVYHGGLDQQHREMALATFASNAARVLVSTDLAGRGLDIADVRAIVHYHPAGDVETWTHRNGRTARIDRNGEIYVITAPDEGTPDFVVTENDYYPDFEATGSVRAPMEMVYLDLGKRDRISRGDIAGFVMKQCGVAPNAVGKITVGTSYSLVAVAPEAVNAVLDGARAARLKGKRVRASRG